METYSSRIQLPTDTPPQLIPPVILAARLSRRVRSDPDPPIDIGFVPFAQDMPLLIESDRVGTSYCPELEFAPLPKPAPSFAFVPSTPCAP